MKILVIDDEKSTRDLLKLSLEADGYEVLLAEDGHRGLEIYEEERTEVVLTDIKMPGMDGIEVLRRIKALHGPTEVIVITGHGEMSLAIEALQLNASDFINKPISDVALQVALRRAKEKLWMRSTLREYTTLLEKKVYDAIRELDHRHELEYELVQASIDGIIVNDRKGNVIVFNQGSERIYGYRASEVIGKINVVDLYPEGLARKMRKLMLSDEFGPPGELSNYETVVLAKDGTQVPVLLSGRPIYERGEEVAAVGYFKDMREIKGLQKDILESELVQASIDGIVVNDSKGNVIVFNEGSERIYGYRAEEVIGRINVRDLYPDGLAKKVKKKIMSDEFGPPGELSNYETVVLAKDGTHVPVLLSARVMSVGGQEVLAVGYFKDMREVKGLLDEMAELVQASIDGIIVNDSKGNVIVFNEGSERIYGYRMEEVIGRINVRDLYPPGLAKDVKRKILSNDWGSSGELSNYETVVLAKDGTHVPVLLSARTLVKGRGEVLAVGYFKDMREIKMLQEELLESERMAAMGHTVASIAHGIKNILHSMNLGAYMLDMGLKKDDHNILTKGWNLVRSNIQRVSKLALDMLSFSRDREPNLKPVNPNELMDKVIDLYSDRARSEGIEIERRYDPFPEDVLVDPDGIENCLVNLFTNAIEAFSEGSEERRVIFTTRNLESSSQEPPGYPTVEFEVRDNAGGIPGDAEKHIFKEIFSTKGAKGTGLGLYITKKSVEEHGGRIDWSTKKGQGTVFTIKLPKILAPKG